MCVRGELDVSTVGTLEVVLVAEMEASTGGVDLDLSGLEFMGFAGVEMLTRLAHRGAARGRPLRVVATNRIVDRVVEIASAQHSLEPTTRERVPLFARPRRWLGRMRATHRHARRRCLVGRVTDAIRSTTSASTSPGSDQLRPGRGGG